MPLVCMYFVIVSHVFGLASVGYTLLKRLVINQNQKRIFNITQQYNSLIVITVLSKSVFSWKHRQAFV